MKNTNQNTTATQAIAAAHKMHQDGFTISYMNANQLEDFIWGYLYDNGLQYKKPIKYVDEFGNQCAVIVYQNNW